MEKIKTVVRHDMPETNSSSSHSVVINTREFDPCLPGDTYWNLDIDESGYIHVQGDRTFGWEWEKHNDVFSKLQYVAAIFCRNETYPQKKLAKLGQIVKEFTGAKGVIFDWAASYKQPRSEDPWERPAGEPEIDHNSSDIFPEIIESEESIKNFIFNKKSWLFLGNDNSSAERGYYDVDENTSQEPMAVLWADLGGSIGRIEFLVDTYPKYPSYVIRDPVNDTILSSIVFDKASHTARPKTASDDGSDPGTLYYFCLNSYSIGYSDEDCSLLWVSHSLKSSLQGLVSSRGLSRSKLEITAEMNKRTDEWVRIPLHLTTDEFGEL